MTFGERITLSREKIGITQRQLAERLNITPVRLNYWEKDKREPDIHMIKALAAVLSVSADYLIGNEDETKKAPITIESDERTERLIDLFSQLNNEGQDRVVEYTDDLVQSGKYIKHSADELAKEA